MSTNTKSTFTINDMKALAGKHADFCDIGGGQQGIVVRTDQGDLLCRPWQTASGNNVAWGVLSTRRNGTRYFHNTGVNVSTKVMNGLPSSVEVFGQVIPITRDHTTNKKTGKISARVKGTRTIEVPGVGAKRVDVRVTEMVEGALYNVCASVRGAGEGGGGLRVTDAL